MATWQHGNMATWHMTTDNFSSPKEDDDTIPTFASTGGRSSVMSPRPQYIDSAGVIFAVPSSTKDKGKAKVHTMVSIYSSN
jgi:hypothetical protein